MQQHLQSEFPQQQQNPINKTLKRIPYDMETGEKVKMMISVKDNILENNEDLQKIIILLTDANDTPIHGRLKFQKMMFLLSDKIQDIGEQTSYDADIFGPYSEIVDEEKLYLEQVGVLYDDDNEIAITHEGKSIAKEMRKNTDKSILNNIKEYKEFLNDLSRNELLAYTYLAYPEMSKHAKPERLRPDIKYHIFSLLKKGKISAERASELLEIPLGDIIKQLKIETHKIN